MIPKFRAWNIESQCMLNHDFIVNTVIHNGEIVRDFSDILEHNDMFILMQSTGMFDKNKNEIYEGDVVNITGIYDHKIMCEVVEYCKRGAYYDVGSFILGNFETHHIEIIGNIYEHPELLEEDDE